MGEISPGTCVVVGCWSVNNISKYFAMVNKFISPLVKSQSCVFILWFFIFRIQSMHYLGLNSWGTAENMISQQILPMYHFGNQAFVGDEKKNKQTNTFHVGHPPKTIFVSSELFLNPLEMSGWSNYWIYRIIGNMWKDKNWSF